MRRHTRFLTSALLAGFVLLPQARPAGQTGQQTSGAPQVTFRAGTNFVEVDAVVTDEQGNFVRDLTAADFEVLEDGQPVTIDAFSLVDLPIETGAAPAAAEAGDEEPFVAEVVTNDRDFDGRIYLIVLDANQISPLRTPQTKELARRFVLENMSGSDQAAIVHVGSEKISQDFTSNKRLLLESIDRFTGQKLRSAVLNKFDDATRQVGVEEGSLAPRDPEAIERAAMARQTMQSIRNLANYMAGIRGRRKAMLLLSEGVGVNMNDTIGPSRLGHDLYRDNDSTEAQYAAEVALHMQNMIETATRANVIVYSVDPRGLTSENDETMGLAGPLGQLDTDLEVHQSVMRGLREELNRSHSQLRSVAEQTGGIALVNTNSFEEGFEGIVEDNSTYYLLGYNTPPKYDGRFHEITVRVKRPDLEVRARKGYYAAKEDPATSGEAPDVLRDLLSSPMPMSGLTMRATSNVFKGDAGNGLVQVTVQFAPDAIAFDEAGGTFSNTVELRYVAYNRDGTAEVNGSKTLDLALQPDSHDAVREHGLRFATEIPLPPGRYQLRVAALDALGGRNGSVFWDVEVPSFSAALAMSDVVITSASTASAPAVNDAETLKTMFPGVAVADRSFTLEDTLRVFAEVYSGGAAAHDIDLRVSVLADDGFELFDRSETKSSADLSPRGSVPYVVDIPLEDLAPGRFVLRIEATSSAGGDPVTRQVPFEIR
jgi:VWFA-related protein